MTRFGDKSFALEVLRNDDDYYENGLRLCLSGRNILEYRCEKDLFTFTCHTLTYIVDWFQENLSYILDETDVCPYIHLNVPTNIPVWQAIQNLNDSNTFLMWEKMWNVIQPWYFRHGWSSARDGAYLANVCFRTIGKKVEISWYNYETYANEGVEFVYPAGVSYVNKETFEGVVNSFLKHRHGDGSSALMKQRGLF